MVNLQSEFERSPEEFTRKVLEDLIELSGESKAFV